MGLFKKPITVKCYTTEELGKLVNWLRNEEGLAALNRQHYKVTAVMAMQYWDNPDKVLYFEVTIPYSKFKKLHRDHILKEVFDPILEQRAFSEILGRQW